MRKLTPVIALALTATLAALSLAPAGCTKAERATANTVLSDVSAEAPVACQAFQAATGDACGPEATGVSAVAALVEAILSSLPPPAARKAGDAAPPGKRLFVYRGVTVTLPAERAAQVWAALQARDGGA